MFKSVNGGILPKRFTKYSCGFDVFANEDVLIGAGETKLVGLGIAIDLEQIKGRFIGAYLSDNGADEYFDEHAFTEFKERHYFALHIRSSLRAKGLTSLGTGVIDIDYDQEIKMVVHNPLKVKEGNMCFEADCYDNYKINKGDKIGQLILLQHAGHLMSDEYTLDNERVGGFGSSGTK